MSKIIYICYKNRLTPSNMEESIRYICNELSPDNISPNPPIIRIGDGISYVIINPVDSVLEHENCILMGGLFNDECRWWDGKKEDLDGSFAIIQGHDDSIKLISDMVGSRTIWYYKDDEIFIASTSQRAIIMLIGSFQFNEEVIPWVISTGFLGPSNSWDERIKILPPDTKIVLDRDKWAIKEEGSEVKFIEDKKDKAFETRLIGALNKTFKDIKLDYSKWVLPLSGGYDSRGILYYIDKEDDNNQKLRTITWGLEQSLVQKGNDAYVAKKLAEHLKLQHNYFFTDVGEEPIKTIIERFILNGEGRTDHINAYMDGFNIFKKLFENGVEGIIRGDEGLGWLPVSSFFQARIVTNLRTCSDFGNLKDYEKFGFQKQIIPEYLKVREGETPAEYRDRLYHGYRIPIMISSWTDLITPYIELINPLLSKNIIEEVRQFPDHLRTDKKLYKTIVTKLFPEIAFAKYDAIGNRRVILKEEEFVDLLKKELSSIHAKTIFPSEFLDYVIKNIKTRVVSDDKQKPSVFEFFIKVTPGWIKRWFVSSSHINIDSNTLAFRMYITSNMHRILNNDASFLKTVCK